MESKNEIGSIYTLADELGWDDWLIHQDELIDMVALKLISQLKENGIEGESVDAYCLANLVPGGCPFYLVEKDGIQVVVISHLDIHTQKVALMAKFVTKKPANADQL